MDVGQSPRASARLVAALFAAAGIVALANALVPQPAGARAATVLIGLADLVVAGVTWLLPWDRWPSWSTITLAPLAFAIIVFANVAADTPSYTYGVFFVVVYLWLGLTMAPRVPLALAPLATAAYIAPFVFGSRHDPDALTSTFVAIPVCVLVGEVLAGTMARVRKAHAATQETEAALRDALAERMRLDRLKSQFVAVVSHELRTPLTSIYASLEMLVDDLAEQPAAVRRLLDISLGSTQRLARLIDDLLDLQRIEAGRARLNRRPCDGASLARMAVELMVPAAADAGLSLRAETESGELLADSDRIVQTLTNLIGNAVKFTPSGGSIRVSTVRTGDGLRFGVVDDGPGVPADRLEAIFEPFVQVDGSDSRAKDGTGLGLAICRDLVAMHGGRIWAESDLGRGAEFYFTVPLAGAAGDAEAPLTAGAGSAASTPR
jgi:signal transduction histidine kinase